VVRSFRLWVVAAKAAPELNTSIIGKFAVGQAPALRAALVQAPDLARLLKAIQALG
jgi:hypothetical protein